MAKAVVRIGFNYGYLQDKYLKDYPEQTGYKVLTEKDGLVLETLDNKFENTKDTICLYADDIITEKGLNNGFYVPLRLKVTEDNVPHFLLEKEVENAVKNQVQNVNPNSFNVVARTQHLTNFVVLKSRDNYYFPKQNDIVAMEIENDDGTFTKLTGNTVCGYLDNGKAIACIETEDSIFKNNEKTVVIHEILNYDGFGDLYDEQGRKVKIEFTEKNKINIKVQPETDYFDTEY